MCLRGRGANFAETPPTDRRAPANCTHFSAAYRMFLRAARGFANRFSTAWHPGFLRERSVRHPINPPHKYMPGAAVTDCAWEDFRTSAANEAGLVGDIDAPPPITGQLLTESTKDARTAAESPLAKGAPHKVVSAVTKHPGSRTSSTQRTYQQMASILPERRRRSS